MATKTNLKDGLTFKTAFDDANGNPISPARVVNNAALTRLGAAANYRYGTNYESLTGDQLASVCWVVLADWVKSAEKDKANEAVPKPDEWDDTP